MKIIAGSMLLAVGLLSGCRSPFIAMDVHNHTGGPITVLEVDYPDASFGKEAIAADADFHYRFKTLGDGGTTVSWLDAAHQPHSYKGPKLYEGQSGHIDLELQPQAAVWELHLTGPHAN